MNQSFETSDPSEFFQQKHLQAASRPQHMNRSFDVSYETSSNSVRNYESNSGSARNYESNSGSVRSFDRKLGGYSSATKEVTVVEGRFLASGSLDNSSESLRLTTSRSGRLLDRSPDRRNGERIPRERIERTLDSSLQTHTQRVIELNQDEQRGGILDQGPDGQRGRYPDRSHDAYRRRIPDQSPEGLRGRMTTKSQDEQRRENPTWGKEFGGQKQYLHVENQHFQKNLNRSLDDTSENDLYAPRTLDRSSANVSYETLDKEAQESSILNGSSVNQFQPMGPDYASIHDTINTIHFPSNDQSRQVQPTKKPMPGLSSQSFSSSSTMRDILNKSQDQSPLDGSLTMDIAHVTNRIISMTFPSVGHDTTYSHSLKEAVRILKSKHNDHFLILNLSEQNQELVRVHSQVKEFGWPDHLAPPLERLCSLCKAIDSWLSCDIRHVVVLHCRAGFSRLASAVAAYMHYNNICASADQAVDSGTMKKYYEEKLGGLPLPSQKRYVSYFAGLLSGAIKINSSPVYLHHILIHGVPDFDSKGGCCPYIRVYQSMQPIFTSGVYNVTDNMHKVCISITPGIPLRGDVLLKCYHKQARTGQKELIWQCQFHTCAVTSSSLVFSKAELDDAIFDPRFPDSGKVEFVFGPSSEVPVSVSGFKSDVTVQVVDNEESLVRTDSYEDFNRISGATVDGFPGNKTQTKSHFTSTGVSGTADSTSSINSSNLHTYNNNNFQAQPNFSTLSRRQPVQTVEERMQLDELLSNLLSDQVTISSGQEPPSSSSFSYKPPSTSLNSLHSPPVGGSSLTVSPGVDSAKTVTTTSRTFTTYSSTDSHRNPDSVLIQRSEISYKVPVPGEATQGLESANNSTTMLDTPSSLPPHPHPRGVPNSAFSYTSGLSSSQRIEHVEREVIHPHSDHKVTSPTSSQLSYYPTFDPKLSQTSSTQAISPTNQESSSWLAQQQQKLRHFREGKDTTGRSDLDRELSDELQFAHNKYYTRYNQNEVQEKVFTDSQINKQVSHNGPVPSAGLPTAYSVSQASHAASAVNGQWQDQFYNTSYSTSSFVESHTYGGDKQSLKPPPSPTAQRSQPAGPAPAPVPARSSSKEYMRTLSSSSNWQQQPHRPVQRQHSETLYDRIQDGDHPQQRSYGSVHNTPPPTPPRAISPTGPHSTTTYTTYRTIDKKREPPPPQPAPVQRTAVIHQEQQHVHVQPPVPPPPSQVSHHYITEVFVHRSDQNKDVPDASQTSRLQQQQQEQQQIFEESLQTRHSSQQQQRYHTYKESVSTEESVSMQQSSERSMNQVPRSRSPPVWDNLDGPEPLRVKEIEEDRIILRPIGPGMQTLEPENLHTGTLGRPSTPGFPTASSHVSGHTGTLPHSQVQQQQHQTVQYQQYQTQQNQGQVTQQEGHRQVTQQEGHRQVTQQEGHRQDTLHIDTSPRMMMTQQSPGSPPSPGSFNTMRTQQMSDSFNSYGPHSLTGQSSPSVYFGLSRRGSLSSLTDSDMVHATPKFVKDTSKYWYKPNISRDEAIQMLKDKPPGSFVIRDSNSFPGAYGLALKVATIPPNVQVKPSGDPQADLVRHFLIEPTPKGVRLRGCSNEPVFGSLAALVYQHSITPLALPWKLAIPEPDSVSGNNFAESITNTAEVSSASTLLAQGAACNVVYVNSVDLESLTGPQAIAKAVKATFDNWQAGRSTVVHFKVFSDGITLTDNNRKLFFRRHYPVAAVTYCGLDPQDRRWKRETDVPGGQGDARLFGFVARKQGSANENTCHIFAELDPEQPASAIVNFVTKVMIGQSKISS